MKFKKHKYVKNTHHVSMFLEVNNYICCKHCFAPVIDKHVYNSYIQHRLTPLPENKHFGNRGTCLRTYLNVPKRIKATALQKFGANSYFHLLPVIQKRNTAFICNTLGSILRILFSNDKTFFLKVQ